MYPSGILTVKGGRRARYGEDVKLFDELECHPNFEGHQAEARRKVVSCDEAMDAWFGVRQIVRNRKDKAGPYLMIGRTRGNRPITVVLLPTKVEGLWTAYTAWDTKTSDY